MQKFLTEIFCTHKSTFHPFKSPPNFWVQPSLQLILHYKKKKNSTSKNFPACFVPICPKSCRNFCRPPNFFQLQIRYKRLMRRCAEIFRHILRCRAIFLPNFARIFFKILGCVFHKKCQKVPKKGKRYLFQYFFLGYSYWLLSSVNIFGIP